jgi:hypothetical protein
MGGGKFISSVPLLLACGCAAGPGNLEIRALPTALAQGARPVSARVAEARGQLALGNVALALEGFRKAGREDPLSVDAFVGMATCYDRMGRFDLSRRYYEQALAIVPTSAQVLGLLAGSLDTQGLRAEAASVRAEIASARASATAVREEAVPALPQTAAAPASAVAMSTPPGDVVREPETVVAAANPAPASAAASPGSPLAIGHSITVRLPPARPVASAEPRPALAGSGAPRLERVSRGEVALVTTSRPLWRPAFAASTTGTAVRFVALPSRTSRVELLNAARIDRLAARTRTWLINHGWPGVAIGDAPAVRARSIIYYPAEQRAVAQRLAAQFGFAMALRQNGRKVTVLLGRDAARAPSGRVPSA